MSTSSSTNNLSNMNSFLFFANAPNFYPIQHNLVWVFMEGVYRICRVHLYVPSDTSVLPHMTHGEITLKCLDPAAEGLDGTEQFPLTFYPNQTFLLDQERQQLARSLRELQQQENSSTTSLADSMLSMPLPAHLPKVLAIDSDQLRKIINLDLENNNNNDISINKNTYYQFCHPLLGGHRANNNAMKKLQQMVQRKIAVQQQQQQRVQQQQQQDSTKATNTATNSKNIANAVVVNSGENKPAIAAAAIDAAAAVSSTTATNNTASSISSNNENNYNNVLIEKNLETRKQRRARSPPDANQNPQNQINIHTTKISTSAPTFPEYLNQIQNKFSEHNNQSFNSNGVAAQQQRQQPKSTPNNSNSATDVLLNVFGTNNSLTIGNRTAARIFLENQQRSQNDNNRKNNIGNSSFSHMLDQNVFTDQLYLSSLVATFSDQEECNKFLVALLLGSGLRGGGSENNNNNFTSRFVLSNSILSVAWNIFYKPSSSSSSAAGKISNNNHNNSNNETNSNTGLSNSSLSAWIQGAFSGHNNKTNDNSNNSASAQNQQEKNRELAQTLIQIAEENDVNGFQKYFSSFSHNNNQNQNETKSELVDFIVENILNSAGTDDENNMKTNMMCSLRITKLVCRSFVENFPTIFLKENNRDSNSADCSQQTQQNGDFNSTINSGLKSSLDVFSDEFRALLFSSPFLALRCNNSNNNNLFLNSVFFHYVVPLLQNSLEMFSKKREVEDQTEEIGDNDNENSNQYNNNKFRMAQKLEDMASTFLFIVSCSTSILLNSSSSPQNNPTTCCIFKLFDLCIDVGRILKNNNKTSLERNNNNSLVNLEQSVAEACGNLNALFLISTSSTETNRNENSEKIMLTGFEKFMTSRGKQMIDEYVVEDRHENASEESSCDDVFLFDSYFRNKEILRNHYHQQRRTSNHQDAAETNNMFNNNHDDDSSSFSRLYKLVVRDVADNNNENNIFARGDEVIISVKEKNKKRLEFWQGSCRAVRKSPNSSTSSFSTEFLPISLVSTLICNINIISRMFCVASNSCDKNNNKDNEIPQLFFSANQLHALLFPLSFSWNNKNNNNNGDQRKCKTMTFAMETLKKRFFSSSCFSSPSTSSVDVDNINHVDDDDAEALSNSHHLNQEYDATPVLATWFSQIHLLGHMILETGSTGTQSCLLSIVCKTLLVVSQIVLSIPVLETNSIQKCFQSMSCSKNNNSLRPALLPSPLASFVLFLESCSRKTRSNNDSENVNNNNNILEKILGYCANPKTVAHRLYPGMSSILPKDLNCMLWNETFAIGNFLLCRCSLASFLVRIPLKYVLLNLYNPSASPKTKNGNNVGDLSGIKNSFLRYFYSTTDEQQNTIFETFSHLLEQPVLPNLPGANNNNNNNLSSGAATRGEFLWAKLASNLDGTPSEDEKSNNNNNNNNNAIPASPHNSTNLEASCVSFILRPGSIAVHFLLDLARISAPFFSQLLQLFSESSRNNFTNMLNKITKIALVLHQEKFGNNNSSSSLTANVANRINIASSKQAKNIPTTSAATAATDEIFSSTTSHKTSLSCVETCGRIGILSGGEEYFFATMLHSWDKTDKNNGNHDHVQYENVLHDNNLNSYSALVQEDIPFFSLTTLSEWRKLMMTANNNRNINNLPQQSNRYGNQSPSSSPSLFCSIDVFSSSASSRTATMTSNGTLSSGTFFSQSKRQDIARFVLDRILFAQNFNGSNNDDFIIKKPKAFINSVIGESLFKDLTSNNNNNSDEMTKTLLSKLFSESQLSKINEKYEILNEDYADRQRQMKRQQSLRTNLMSNKNLLYQLPRHPFLVRIDYFVTQLFDYVSIMTENKVIEFLTKVLLVPIPPASKVIFDFIIDPKYNKLISDLKNQFSIFAKHASSYSSKEELKSLSLNNNKLNQVVAFIGGFDDQSRSNFLTCAESPKLSCPWLADLLRTHFKVGSSASMMEPSPSSMLQMNHRIANENIANGGSVVAPSTHSNNNPHLKNRGTTENASNGPNVTSSQVPEVSSSFHLQQQQFVQNNSNNINNFDEIINEDDEDAGTGFEDYESSFLTQEQQQQLRSANKTKNNSKNAKNATMQNLQRGNDNAPKAKKSGAKNNINDTHADQLVTLDGFLKPKPPASLNSTNTVTLSENNSGVAATAPAISSSYKKYSPGQISSAGGKAIPPQPSSHRQQQQLEQDDRDSSDDTNLVNIYSTESSEDELAMMVMMKTPANSADSSNNNQHAQRSRSFIIDVDVDDTDEAKIANDFLEMSNSQKAREQRQKQQQEEKSKEKEKEKKQPLQLQHQERMMALREEQQKSAQQNLQSQHTAYEQDQQNSELSRQLQNLEQKLIKTVLNIPFDDILYSTLSIGNNMNSSVTTPTTPTTGSLSDENDGSEQARRQLLTASKSNVLMKDVLDLKHEFYVQFRNNERSLESSTTSASSASLRNKNNQQPLQPSYQDMMNINNNNRHINSATTSINKNNHNSSEEDNFLTTTIDDTKIYADYSSPIKYALSFGLGLLFEMRSQIIKALKECLCGVKPPSSKKSVAPSGSTPSSKSYKFEQTSQFLATTNDAFDTFNANVVGPPRSSKSGGLVITLRKDSDFEAASRNNAASSNNNNYFSNGNKFSSEPLTKNLQVYDFVILDFYVCPEEDFSIQDLQSNEAIRKAIASAGANNNTRMLEGKQCCVLQTIGLVQQPTTSTTSSTAENFLSSKAATENARNRWGLREVEIVLVKSDVFTSSFVKAFPSRPIGESISGSSFFPLRGKIKITKLGSITSFMQQLVAIHEIPKNPSLWQIISLSVPKTYFEKNPHLFVTASAPAAASSHQLQRLTSLFGVIGNLSSNSSTTTTTTAAIPQEPQDGNFPVDKLSRVGLRADQLMSNSNITINKSQSLVMQAVFQHQFAPYNFVHNNNPSPLAMNDITSSVSSSSVFINQKGVRYLPASAVFCQGPPGTGKSSLIVATTLKWILMARQLRRDLTTTATASTTTANRHNNSNTNNNNFLQQYAKRYSAPVLICAPSNAAIDEVLVRLARLNKVPSGLADSAGTSAATAGATNLKLVRIGVRDSIADEVLEQKLFIEDQIQEKLQEQQQALAMNAGGGSGGSTTTFAQNNGISNVNMNMNNNNRNRNSSNNVLNYFEMRDEILNNADVVCATLGSIKTWLPKNFSFVIIDEASQAIEPSVIVPLALCGCQRALIVGDPKQLRPVVISEEEVLKRSLMERFFEHSFSLNRRQRLQNERDQETNNTSFFSRNSNNNNNNVPDSRPLVTASLQLSEQYRMHPAISNFSNAMFYRNQIKDSPEIMQISQQDDDEDGGNNNTKNSKNSNTNSALSTIANITPFAARRQFSRLNGVRIGPQRLIFVDVKGIENCSGSGSTWNELEARVVFQLLYSFYNHLLARNADKLRLVSIITFYQAQKKEIRFKMPDHLRAMGAGATSTVDSFQGQEAPATILSLVRAGRKVAVAGTRAGGASSSSSGNFNSRNNNINNGTSSNNTVGFLDNENRLNVALTRAQDLLVVVGDADHVSKHCRVLGALVEQCKARHGVDCKFFGWDEWVKVALERAEKDERNLGITVV